ncbi:MAG: TIGR01212 family radical SAM protein [Lachnospiraceae bacterium]|nr:TIGR01212 family radical SAM protein [Lachnospiraceae bacterium]
MFPDFWLDRPYYSLDAYCKKRYGAKVYKIALDAGLTCPNRDGTLGNRGCIFCSAGGSGDFAVKPMDSVAHQLKTGQEMFGKKKTGNLFIAYFQAYTNTYGNLAYLAEIYEEALKQPQIVGISIATRPDCLPKEVLDLLVSLQEKYPHKDIWVELGLQTIHDSTAAYIRRGYKLEVFDTAVANLKSRNIPVIVHVILGLPGETADMVLRTLHYLNRLSIFGIKLQLLHVLKDTDLATDYLAGKFETLSKEEYMSLLILCLKNLSPDIVIHRLTGDGPKDLLIAPTWSLYKRDFFNTLHRHLKQTGEFQGQDFHTYTEPLL